MLDQVVKAVNDLAMVEQRSMMEGRRMVMVIGPRGGVIRAPGPTTPTTSPPIVSSSPPRPVTVGGSGVSAPPTAAPAVAVVAPKPAPAAVPVAPAAKPAAAPAVVAKPAADKAPAKT
jgi:hypothetical protein